MVKLISTKAEVKASSLGFKLGLDFAIREANNLFLKASTLGSVLHIHTDNVKGYKTMIIDKCNSRINVRGGIAR